MAPEPTPQAAEAIRRRVDAYTGPDHYRFTIDGIEYDGHWAHDLRRLLDENTRLTAKLAEAEAQIEAGRRAEKGEPCPECGGTVSPFRDAWGREAFKACTSCTWPLPGADGAPRTAPGMPHPPAQERASGPETSEAGSGRGTGEREPHGRSEPVVWGQGANCPHRPEWHCENHGECRGCECGCDTVNPEVSPLGLIPDELIESNPGIRGGEPCITGTRIPAHEVAGYLADGATWDEVREMLPSLPSLPVPSTEEQP